MFEALYKATKETALFCINLNMPLCILFVVFMTCLCCNTFFSYRVEVLITIKEKNIKTLILRIKRNYRNLIKHGKP
jgi:hypothetical protein